MKEEGVFEKPAHNPSAGMIRIRFSGLAFMASQLFRAPR